jgi:hypothetical protein
MKKLLFFLTAVVLFISIFSTTAIESAGSAAVPRVEFSSLEEYLNAYLAYKEGRNISDYIEGGWRIQDVNITEIEALFLPINISENFIIRRVSIDESISFQFLPKNVNFTKDTFWDAITNNPSFSLSIWLNRENRIDSIIQSRGLTADDLIDGKYLAEYYPLYSYMLFYWQSDSMLLVLHINLHQQHTEEFKKLFGDGDVLDLVRFAETRTVDLTDEEEVRNLIRFGERFQRGDISGSGRLTTSDALEVLRYVAGLENVIEGDERAEVAADVNSDGKIDTADALAILRIVAGIAV